MKKYIITLFAIFCFQPLVCANSINPALYQVIQKNQYQNNYRRYNTNRVIPYWQAQSNYSTRGRIYQNYSGYSNYINQPSPNRSYR